jgi:hypothetical protein
MDEMIISKFAIEKFNNFDPLNVHQTSPYESLWGCFAQKVNGEGREAKTEQQIIYCTESSLKEFDEHFVERLLEGVKAKVKWIGETVFIFCLNKFF